MAKYVSIIRIDKCVHIEVQKKIICLINKDLKGSWVQKREFAKISRFIDSFFSIILFLFFLVPFLFVSLFSPLFCYSYLSILFLFFFLVFSFLIRPLSVALRLSKVQHQDFQLVNDQHGFPFLMPLLFFLPHCPLFLLFSFVSSARSWWPFYTKKFGEECEYL